jgi:hypothetical protein
MEVMSPASGVAMLALPLLLAACGAIPGPSSGCLAQACPYLPSPGPSAAGSPAAVSATAHGWTTDAGVRAGGGVDVRVNVSGPLTVDGGCSPTLTAWLVAADGHRLQGGSAPAARCQGIAVTEIPAGQTRDFVTSLDLPPAGTYSVHGLVLVHLPIGAGARVAENIPVVTLTIP